MIVTNWCQRTSCGRTYSAELISHLNYANVLFESSKCTHCGKNNGYGMIRKLTEKEVTAFNKNLELGRQLEYDKQRMFERDNASLPELDANHEFYKSFHEDPEL